MQKETWRHTFLLAFQSLGIVYGRLSTAPLYVFMSIPREDIISEQRVYELFSFVFWTMTIIPLLKYAFIVLRADDNGEGGTFALYSLLCRHAKVGLHPNDRSANEVMKSISAPASKTKVESRARRAIEKHKSSHYLMLFLALFGSCMVIGDGVLTPAISVLSASSGFERSMSHIAHKIASSQRVGDDIEKAFKRYVPVPFACAILVGLFTLQHYGTHKIGFLFAPIIVIWLFFISGVGLYNIFYSDHQIIYAVSPVYMYRFMRNFDHQGWRSLGSILLSVAGSEAMFADLGHFSKKSLKITFVCLIYPALILCYAGQAAFISKNWRVFEDVTYLSESVPGAFLRHIVVLLSLLASAVGSQATITASFSVINQCLALGCFPRVKVIHTSDTMNGRVYIPDVNWLLMILSLGIVIAFQDIARIGNATGLAIISGMLVTTCLMSLVITLYWEKSLFVSACFLLSFGLVEIMYLSACMSNFHKGAWYLVVLFVFSMTIMLSWHYGTMKKYEFDLQNKVSMEWITEMSPGLGVSRVPGIGFIYTDIVSGIPAFFSHFITNLPAYHQVLIFVSFKSLPVPCVPKSREGRMIVVGNPMLDGNTLVPIPEMNSNLASPRLSNNGTQRTLSSDSIESASALVTRRKVRFMLPPESPRMQVSVRAELQELVDARESGTAYFLGQSHLKVRDGSSFLKRFLIMTYVFLDKNCREPPVALNIPHAALVELDLDDQMNEKSLLLDSFHFLHNSFLFCINANELEDPLGRKSVECKSTKKGILPATVPRTRARLARGGPLKQTKNPGVKCVKGLEQSSLLPSPQFQARR
ncbi:Potassium transporter 25 [Vitis vinifera]|uniref:Potassium transporter n=1 Tax=Vitis vinifera TaxID=29760 RepID=A0A438EXN3_VITVI|nr:Potassium transporter 25 [Vitis vinifera]